MITQKELTTIEKYLSCKLDGAELARFNERLEKDKNFVEEVFIQKMIKEAAEEAYLLETWSSVAADRSLDSFSQAMQAIDEAYHTEINIEDLLSFEPSVQEEKEPQTYTLDDLLDMFGVVEEYEEAMALAERAGELKVIVPQNGMDIKGSITFQLEVPLDSTLKLRIENNKKQNLITQKIDAGVSTFTVTLPTEQFEPGRYYWKLWGREGMVIRSFFVAKDRMPNG